MNNPIIRLLAVVLSIAAVGTACKTSSKNSPVVVSDTMRADKSEINALKQKVKQGDNKAAYDLANIYLYGYQDDKQGMKWLKLAAKMGNQDAIESLRNISEEPSGTGHAVLMEKPSGEQAQPPARPASE